MKIILENTSTIIAINGVPTRIWQGKTESGIPIHAHVALIGVARNQDTAEFERELKERPEPRAAIGDGLSLRYLID